MAWQQGIVHSVFNVSSWIQSNFDHSETYSDAAGSTDGFVDQVLYEDPTKMAEADIVLGDWVGFDMHFVVD